jgi:hypothetical protein
MLFSGDQICRKRSSLNHQVQTKSQGFIIRGFSNA